MNQNVIRCRCGHRVLGREVLRTEFYERRTPASDPFLGESIREYVYVKFRCKRCKRMGENFIPDSKWDWKMLEPDHNELNDIERDFFLDEEPLSTQDIVDLHNQLENVATFHDLQTALSPDASKDENASASAERSTPSASNTNTSSTRCVRNSEPRPNEPRSSERSNNERQGDMRQGDMRQSDARPGDQSSPTPKPSATPKPPIPPIASDDSSRK